MGTLKYGTRELPVEDRLLAHVGVVVTQKLRRRECFLLTLHPADRRSETDAIWVSAYNDISFAYSGNRIPSLNHAWLELMMTQSYSMHGLDLTSAVEPVPEGVPARTHIGTRAS